MIRLTLWYLAAFAASAATVPACRAFARRRGYVARPRADRWHAKPTALLGGVGIAVTALTLAILSDPGPSLLPVLIGGGLMFLVGVADDVIVSLKPSTKLIAEIAVASLLLVFFPARLQWTDSALVDTLLTLVWLLGVTNAFNLLDNMDGLCAGVALIAGFWLMVGLYSFSGVIPETQYLAILLGATSGFLIYNAHPASIFMGDAGSLFLGLSIATLTLTTGGPAHDRSNVLSIIGVPVLIVLIPILDTTLVTMSRLIGGRRVSQGGRDHSSHRLVAIGLSERAAVGVLWTLAFAAGTIAFFIREFSNDWSWFVGALFVLSMAVFAVYLAHVRVYPDASEAPQRGITPVVVNFMYKRRVAEVVLDVCLVTAAYYMAWRLRFDSPTEWADYSDRFLESLPIVLGIQMVTLFVVGAYRGDWRYFGLMDGVLFGKGVLAGTAALIVSIVYLYHFQNYSRVVFVSYASMLMLMLCVSRASFRLIGEFARRRRAGTRLVIYGAGQGGALVLRELLHDPHTAYTMLGFIDDDPARHRLRLHGYPVLGDERVVLKMIANRTVDVVVVSSRQFAPSRIRVLADACRENDVRLLRFHFNLEDLVPCA
jgi:UDP-GlcNAc:undecaprenyl-phosphate GlcNAc-1-phosphate transferase